MKRIIIFSALILLLPFLSVFAQGTDGGAVDPSSIPSTTTSTQTITPRQAIATTTPATEISPANTLPPRGETAQPSEASTAPTPRPLIPSVTNHSLLQQESEATTTEETSTTPITLVGLAVVGLVIALGGYVAYKQSKKMGAGATTENHDNKSRCFDIKKLMDKKLEELTDLSGQLEGKIKGEVKELGREKVREILKGTPEGKLLALIESGEKEYNRLKQLFDKCMIDFEGQKKVIIIHGCPSNTEKALNHETRTYDKHWIPWLKKELITRGIKVETPLMPDPWEPDYQKFKKEFEKYEVSENSVLVGHSCGCAFLVRWLGETKKKINKLILVAPWKINDGENKFREAFYTYEVDESLRSRISEIVMFTSDDEEEDGKKSLQIFHSVLGGKIINLDGRGHYTMGDMKTVEFPELLEEIVS